MTNSDLVKNHVVGFLIPIFMEDRPDGERLNGLAPSDFEKVRHGYACARCLAEFDMYMLTCPVCGLQRDLAADIQEAPQLWLDHLHEHNSDVPAEKPAVINPFADGGKLPDMDTIPANKMKRRWGKG